MLATDDDALLPFSLPSIDRKKITAAFDGGRISSDGGVLLLAGVDKQIGLIDRLAAIIPDHRDPELITHSMPDILRPHVSPSPAAIRMRMILTICARTPPSSSPADGCRKPALI